MSINENVDFQQEQKKCYYSDILEMYLSNSNNHFMIHSGYSKILITQIYFCSHKSSMNCTCIWWDFKQELKSDFYFYFKIYAV